MKTKLNEVFIQTSQISHNEGDVVASVMGHVFKQLHSYLKDPNAPGVRLPHLGVIRPNINSLNHYLSNELKNIRKYPQFPSYKEKFRRYWKLRDIILKDNERRKYSERPEGWHWKGGEEGKTGGIKTPAG